MGRRLGVADRVGIRHAQGRLGRGRDLGCAPGLPGLGPGTHIAEHTRAVKGFRLGFGPQRRIGRESEPSAAHERPGAHAELHAPRLCRRPRRPRRRVQRIERLDPAVGPADRPLPSGQPSDAPASPSDVGALEHPTGATDVILRYDVGGGMMIAGWTASQAPIFTLYGDGTLIFRNPAQEAASDAGFVLLSNPLRTARLSEEQIQEAARLRPRGRRSRGRPGPVRQPDGDRRRRRTTFTINAGGVKKAVSIYALGIEDAPGVPDIQARAEPSPRWRPGSATSTRAARSRPTSTLPTALPRHARWTAPGMVDPNVIAWPWRTSRRATSSARPTRTPSRWPTRR